MLRQITPRNARSKRALEKRAPKAAENPKTCLFLRGTTCSQLVQDCLTDLHAMRTPLAKKFTKKNAVHPFEDPASLEFFSRKNDASLLLFGSSSKKRRHCLTLCRTFDYQMLDMLEMYVDERTARRAGPLDDGVSTDEAATAAAAAPTTEEGKEAEKKKKKARSFPIGARPMLLFAGTPFYEGGDGGAATTETGKKYALAKSLLTDFFRGDSTPDKIDVEGLSHIVVATAEEPQPGTETASSTTTTATATGEATTDASALPMLHLRVYALTTKRSGQRLPRIELEEIGPRLDVRLGRFREPDTALLREALRKPKTSTEARTKKNIETDRMGDKVGRIHVGRQDVKDLQTRKMKGLKRRRGEDDTDGAAGNAAGSAGDDDGDATAEAVNKALRDITGVVKIQNELPKRARRS